MQEIIESFFKERSLVNHQLASYNDCIPSTVNQLSRMERIIRNIRVGTDDEIIADIVGYIKQDFAVIDISSRLTAIKLGALNTREATGT